LLCSLDPSTKNESPRGGLKAIVPGPNRTDNTCVVGIFSFVVSTAGISISGSTATGLRPGVIARWRAFVVLDCLLLFPEA
jgi:hypothetical protein